ncbi:MAG: polysaccharide export outer membrane protein [Bacteroidia bacterium]|jgi:polysaccharide export outer membrane protein
MNLFKLTKFLPPIIVFFALSMSSCKVQNMFVEDKHYEIDSTFFLKPELYEHVVRPGDKITISVWDHDDLSIGSIYTIHNSNEVFGKWVTVGIDSTIPVPKLGRVHIAGLHISEVESLLTEKMSKYVVNPAITVKVLNKEVNVIGKVRTPGQYTLEKDQTTIIDALAMAQGTVYYADKKHVRLVRDGKTYILDLTKLDAYHLTNLTVRAGDLLIVPSKKASVFDQKINVIIPFASAISALTIAASFIVPALQGN